MRADAVGELHRGQDRADSALRAADQALSSVDAVSESYRLSTIWALPAETHDANTASRSADDRVDGATILLIS
jgi:hypothetical protein